MAPGSAAVTAPPKKEERIMGGLSALKLTPLPEDKAAPLTPPGPPEPLSSGASPTSLGRSPADTHLWKRKSLLRLFSVTEDSSLGAIGAVPHCRREHGRSAYERPWWLHHTCQRPLPLSGMLPSQSLQAHQPRPNTMWNWDSAIVAAGWAVFDEERAWEEVEYLFSGQWEDGMVPSIIFHQYSDTYFPGPEIWGTPEKPSKSTGISQPPVAAMSVRFLFEHAEDPQLAERKMVELFPKLLAWHRWWYKARDPEGKGVVAILHPWESGMDNSPAWDESMRFAVERIPPYVRRDLNHVNASMRPDKDTYDHYLTLLYLFKSHNYDYKKLYWVSPFRVTDLCINSILFRANRDLRWLAVKLGKDEVAAEIDGWLEKGFRGFKQLWDQEAGIFKCQDQITAKLANASISAGFLPLFAGVASKSQGQRLVDTLTTWQGKVKYGVPSMDPADARFEALRYWRGPVWIIINWMISNGLKHYGYNELAKEIKEQSIELTGRAGLREYFDPTTGDGAGGSAFSWTASMCLSWLDRPAAIAIGHKMSGPKKHLEHSNSNGSNHSSGRFSSPS
eukprot:SM000056S17968  [mRNA]  locus=s56:348787:351834:- [translate_table: standard]